MMPHCPRSTATHGVINAPQPPDPVIIAFQFMKSVRELKEVYYPFMLIIRAYAQHSCPASRVLSMIERLINHHVHLRREFVVVKTEVKLMKLNEKIKDRLAKNDKERYLQYFAIMNGFRRGQKRMIEMVSEVAELFADHLDLFLEFCSYLPDDTSCYQ